MRRLTPILSTAWRSIQGRSSPMRGTIKPWMPPHTANKATPAQTSVQAKPRATRHSRCALAGAVGGFVKGSVMGTAEGSELSPAQVSEPP